MRISDWSSDVCSSDLIGPLIRDPLRILLRRELFPVARLKRNVAMTADIIEMRGKVLRALLPPRNLDQHLRGSAHYARKRPPHINAAKCRYRPHCTERPVLRTEEHRLVEPCGRTCNSTWTPQPS